MRHLCLRVVTTVVTITFLRRMSACVEQFDSSWKKSFLISLTERNIDRENGKISTNLGMTFAIIKIFASGKEDRWCLPLAEGCLPAAE